MSPGGFSVHDRPDQYRIQQRRVTSERRAAAWLLRMPEDITVVGDAAVLQSIERLRERLRRMTASA